MPKHKVFDDTDSEAEDCEPSRVPVDDVEDDLASVESDEDAEPETITFKDSKQTVLDRVRFALRQIEHDKQLTKEKRRKRDEIFREQKKQKLSRLEAYRLPDEMLETLDSELSARPNDVTPQNFENVSTKFEEDTADNGSSPVKQAESNDYIPLDSNIRAITSKQLRQISSTSLSALDFRYKQLYGNRVLREPECRKAGDKLRLLSILLAIGGPSNAYIVHLCRPPSSTAMARRTKKAVLRSK